MADHPRKVIRAAAVSMLATPDANGDFPTGAKARFHDSRDFPVDARTMPVGLIYTESEEFDPEHMHDNGVRRRIMQMKAEFYQVGENAAADVDEGAWQIENAFYANPTINDLAESVRLTRMESAFADNGEYALWTAVLTLEVVYWTHVQPDTAGRPTTVLLGFDPDTGPGHESDYSQVIGV